MHSFQHSQKFTLLREKIRLHSVIICSCRMNGLLIFVLCLGNYLGESNKHTRCDLFAKFCWLARAQRNSIECRNRLKRFHRCFGGLKIDCTAKSPSYGWLLRDSVALKGDGDIGHFFGIRSLIFFFKDKICILSSYAQTFFFISISTHIFGHKFIYLNFSTAIQQLINKFWYLLSCWRAQCGLFVCLNKKQLCVTL